ncbi:MAG: hypothetical protein WD766_09725 [Gemmatimonadota bacterium]
MFNWIRRRRLSPEARKRLLLVSARAEEAIVETHVSNVLDLLDSLGDEIDFDRALEIYSEMMSLEETRASTVASRLLARLESPTPRYESAAARRATPADRQRRYRNVFRDETLR